MHKIIFHTVFNFIFLILLQVLLLNNVQIFGFVQPYVYVLCLLSLPLTINRNLIILLGFLLGITIDIFSNSLGLHASACLLLALFRAPVLKLLVGSDESLSSEISPKSIGFSKYLMYIVSLVLIHHLSLFYLDYFSTVRLELILFQALSSALCTVLLILLLQLLKRKYA